MFDTLQDNRDNRARDPLLRGNNTRRRRESISCRNGYRSQSRTTIISRMISRNHYYDIRPRSRETFDALQDTHDNHARDPFLRDIRDNNCEKHGAIRIATASLDFAKEKENQAGQLLHLQA